MPGQGWAGSNAPTASFKCAYCLQEGRDIPAVTLWEGTAVCANHINDRVTVH